MYYARSTRKASNRGTYAGKERTARGYQQRCAVRVTYLNSKTRGQWKAHGRYLARESAAGEADCKRAGFSRDKEGVDIASELEAWQKAGDQRLWKLIVSPEFGERIDLRRLTRYLLERMAADLGTDLERVAVEHYNTEHPHVHIVVRAKRDDGEVWRMSRQFVQQVSEMWLNTFARINLGTGHSSMRRKPNDARSRRSDLLPSTEGF